jgi:F0F1-type ATP synthase alpha subunit
MALKASEISTLIKERIENFEASAEARDVGTVIAVTDGIATVRCSSSRRTPSVWHSTSSRTR